MVLVVLGVGFCWMPGRADADWLQFRGTTGNGVATPDTSAANAPPVSWKDATNVAWKSELPGRGLSSPIVVGNRVVVTANSGVRQDRLHVLCFDRDSGAEIWHRQFWATGMTHCHPKTSMAAPSPASDGKRIYALYSCNDLACLDLDGNVLWLRALMLDYPNAANSVGLSASPVVVDDTLVVQIENESVSFAAGLNTSDGVNRWKLDRPRALNWSSPVPVGPTGVLLQSTSEIAFIEARSGKVLWTHAAACGAIPSSTVTEKVFVIPSEGMTALKCEGSIASKPTIVWKSNKMTADTPSPLIYDERIYAVGGSILRCADLQTGEVKWRLRLKGPFSGSLVAAGGRIYCFSEEGVCQVVQPGDGEGTVVGTSELGESVLCTPAISDGGLFVRSDKHLWKIAKTGG
jgi:outer membrane protein assembly factor BamB